VFRVRTVYHDVESENAMRRFVSRGWVCAWAALAVAAATAPAQALITFGTLSNFDVINDTGQVCHGFDIELEGVHPADVAFTFGAPYIRYGDPQIIDTGTGVTIRYASTFSGSAWAAGTPAQDPLNPIVTGGHQLFFQGDPNYINLPGDHFGVALNGTPTSTVYHWLQGDATGFLSAVGSAVKLPAPILTVAPAANPVVAPAAVQMQVLAPPKEPAKAFGEAMWVKVFITESTAPAELEHMVVGDAAMPDRNDVAETEIEWQLLQEGKNGMEEIDSGLDDLKPGSESITRRYEFYKYSGAYDPEGEATDEVPTDATVGDFIGGQNVAINLAAFAVPEPASLLGVGLGLAGLTLRRGRRSR
jgi:hypothetical protein